MSDPTASDMDYEEQCPFGDYPHAAARLVYVRPNGLADAVHSFACEIHSAKIFTQAMACRFYVADLQL